MPMRQLICLTALSLFATGCMSLEAVHQGDLDKTAPHAVTPKNDTLYRIQNIRKPGSKVFLFVTPDALARCFEQIKAKGDSKKICASGILADVNDGTRVKTVDCNSSEYAICVVKPIEGHNAGVKGAILWDWLTPDAN